MAAGAPMRVVWKYELHPGVTFLDLPSPSLITHVGVQEERVYLWALVDPDGEKQQHVFRTLATGERVDDEPGELVGSVQMDTAGGQFVFHVFQERGESHRAIR